MASTREEWAGRVAAWRRSGRTAKAYAESIGVNAGTLAYWGWRLGREQRRKPSAKRTQALKEAAPALIEVVQSGGSAAQGFEIHLRSGDRVQVPVGFDAAALKRLIAVLEEQP